MFQKRLWIGLAGLSLGLLVNPTWAHHPDAEASPVRSAAKYSFGLDFDAAQFGWGGFQGKYLATVLKGSASFSPVISAGLRVPTYKTWIEGFQSQFGMGDVEVVLRAKTFTPSESTSFWVGINSELPTGSKSKGLSSGHIELAPFVSGISDLGAFSMLGSVGVLTSLHGHHDENEEEGSSDKPNFVAPHASKELHYQIGAAVSLSARWFSQFIIGGFTALGKEQDFPGTSGFTSAQLRYSPEPGSRVTIQPQLGLGGHRRSDWRVTIGWDRFF